MREQFESKSHEAEVIMTRIKQSTHHQQLTHLQELKDTIGQLNGGRRGKGERDFRVIQLMQPSRKLFTAKLKSQRRNPRLSLKRYKGT